MPIKIQIESKNSKEEIKEIINELEEKIIFLTIDNQNNNIQIESLKKQLIQWNNINKAIKI